jgi:large subunit ribosomal protein L35
MKSHRGAAKRFRKTGKGKIVHQQQGRRHFMAKRSRKRNRRLGRDAELGGGDRKRVQQLIPYL